jgi:predicted GIY-YIG superfamily endonuclease
MGNWNYEKCKEEALKYSTKSEFKKSSNRAYRIINNNKWYELTEHLLSKINNWSYEKCKQEVSKYKTKKEFRKTKAYSTIIKNGWHELIYSLPNDRHDKWTYEECKKVSLMFENKGDFRKSYGGAYHAIRDNKWFELYDHMNIIGNKYNRLVYVYEFENNFCYVGLTSNINRRNNQHLYDESSAVYIHIKINKIEPKLIIKTDYIKVEDSILMEEKVLIDYKDKGWNILNKVKTGSIEGNGLIWTKEACIKEIQKYKNLKDFRENCGGAHNSIQRNKWAEELYTKYFKEYKRRKIKKS